MSLVAADSSHGSNGNVLLEVDDLRVDFTTTDGSTVHAVNGVSFELARGKCLAIVGESGSGKSATARALVDLAGGNATITAAQLRFDGRDLTRLEPREWLTLRGRSIGFVLQDALNSMDPYRRIDREVVEAPSVHRLVDRKRRRELVTRLLERAGVPDPEARQRQYPHELSGGLRQRALIASAIAADPQLLIADEPTTALDVTVQRQILALLDDLKRAGTALILISHDLAVVARIADEVLVMKDGEIVERGPAQQLLTHPDHPYTQALVRAVPHVDRAPREVIARDESASDTILTVEKVSKRFAGPGWTERQAVDGVSLTVDAGETLGIVGESGSGKTTLARIILGLVEPDSGVVDLQGRQWSGIPERDRRHRRSLIQPVHQNPLDSIDPRAHVHQAIAEGLDRTRWRGAEKGHRVAELLEMVQLPEAIGSRRPHELSGGQLQRVAIARALAAEPILLVCDEPVSALDVTVQAQVLAVFRELQDQLGLALMFISHDLGVIQQVSHRVLVMKDGRAVESGPVGAIYSAPTHPYTTELLDAVSLPRHIAPRPSADLTTTPQLQGA